MKKLFVNLFCLITGVMLSQAPEKASPFTAVKWEDQKPIVQFENEWYEVKQIDQFTIQKILAYANEKYGDRMQKRFSEDLVEVLKGMGHTPQATIKLVLVKNGKTVTKTGNMTAENRQAVLKYNRENSAAPSTTSSSTILTSNSTNSSGTDKKLFNIKSAKIVYEYTGFIKGTDIFWFDDYGKVAVLEQNRKELFGNVKKTIYWKDKKSTIVDHDKKESATSSFRPKDTEPPTIAEVSESQIKSEGYVKLAGESVAGKDCAVYLREKENSKVQYWLWNKIDLKVINNALGSKSGYTKIAISVQENVSIPAELLSVPAGYKVR